MIMLGRSRHQWRPKGSQELITAPTTLPARWRVSEWQRSWLCGQNLCVAFIRLYWHNERRREQSSNGGRWHDNSAFISTTKVSFSTIIMRLCHCIYRSRWCSQNLYRPFRSSQTFITYYIWHNFSPTRSVMRGESLGRNVYPSCTHYTVYLV